MSSHKARIERANRRGMDDLDLELTIVESGSGHRSWKGAFTSPSVANILPDERLSVYLNSGEKGTARVNETRFDSRNPSETTVHFTGIGPLA